MKYKIIDPNQ